MKALRSVSLAAVIAAALFTTPSRADIGAGVTDTIIRIGNTNPYSGPASSYGTIGRTMAAYFDKVNDEGGIGGRKIEFITYDDAYSPPKTVEQTRRLVERDDVLLIVQALGTATNTAVREYLNAKKVPQLFVSSGATKWGDPENYPWTMGWHPNYQSEARIYARYLLENRPDARIAVLYQNDDYGRDYLKGLKDGLGTRAADMILAEEAYEVMDPTVDSQVLKLKASGADTFFNVATPKFAAQAIRRSAELGWKPLHILNNVANAVDGVLVPAGLANAVGILTTFYYKDPTDPRWQDDAALARWRTFMADYFPEGDTSSTLTVYGYIAAQGLEHVLREASDDLSRENVMRVAANIRDLELDMLLPGITVNTGPNDYFPIEQMQMARFNGERWELFGPILSGEPGK